MCPMSEYYYIRCHQSDLQSLLDKYAGEGWTVHTFTASGALAHVLFERAVSGVAGGA